MDEISDVPKIQNSYERFIPEPESSAGIRFTEVLGRLTDTAVGVASSAIPGNPMYTELINKQIEVQQQMMVTTMQSNVEKSKHETQMAPVRNIRVG